MSPNPSWEPLTDNARSLSIGALAFDPTDATHQTLVAGTGRYSSNNRTGTALIGWLRTADGRASWEVVDGGKLLRNAQIVGVAPRGAIIAVASDKGLFRSSEDGQWKKISGAPDSGLPNGFSFVLLPPPDTNNIKIAAGPNHTLFVAVANYANGAIPLAGLFRSGDGGSSWTALDLPRTIQAGGLLFRIP